MEEEKIAFYCRVSTDKQKEENTIEKQLYNLNSIYKERNVVAKYLDDGFSGSLESRPALLEMKEGARSGVYNVLAIDVIDRSTRGGAKMLEPMFDFLIKNGVRIEIGGIPVDYKTPQGKFSNNVQAEAVRLAKEIIVQNMINGKYAKASKGILIGSYPSWGYKLIKTNREMKEPARFVEDPVEANKVRECFRIYAQEQNLYKTSNILFEMGIYPRGKKGEEGKYKKHFLATSLRRVLANENYIGIHYFGKRISCEADPKRYTKRFSKTRNRGGLTGTKYRPKSEWKKIEIPAIIDETLFNTVQSILARRRKDFFRETKYHYLLQKLIRCPYCGSYYRGLASGYLHETKDGIFTKYFSYVCYKKFQTKDCQSKSISGRYLEKKVWEKVCEFISNPEKIKKAVLDLAKSKTANKVTNQKTLNNLLERKAEIEKQISNLVEYISDGKIRKDDLYAKIDPLNSERESLEQQIEKTKKDIESIEESVYMDKMVIESCNVYVEKLDNPDFNLKRKIVRDWVKEVRVYDMERIEVDMRVPEINGIDMNNQFKVLPLLK